MVYALKEQSISELLNASKKEGRRICFAFLTFFTLYYSTLEKCAHISIVSTITRK